MIRLSRLSKIPDDKFIFYVSKSNKLSDVAAFCGYSIKSSKASVGVSVRIKSLGLSILHFDNWNSKANTPTTNFLVYGSTRDNQTIKKRIIKECIFPYRCAECYNEGTHNGKELVLHLDHVDGDPKNNVLSNLRFLCPNCHSQTPTYGGKNNNGKKKK